MPRNSSGTYTLPAGNPVAPNTLIETNWANPTLSDVAASITDSLDRLGRGTMLAPLKIFDGTAAAPALSFNSEATLGLFRPVAGALGVSVGGAEVARFTAAALSLFGALSVAGAVTFSGGITGPVAITGAVSITGTLSTTGAATFDSLSVTNAATVGGMLFANGGATLGDAPTDPLLISSTTATITAGGLNFAGGNVGIGRSPLGRLDVLGGADAFFRISDGTIEGLFQARTSSAGAAIGTLTNHPLLFWTNNGERMRIDAAGNVGLGTSTPTAIASYRALALDGASGSLVDLRHSGALVGRIASNNLGMVIDSTLATPLSLNTNAIERMRIDAAGNVSIGGAASVGEKVTVYGSVLSIKTNDNLRVVNATLNNGGGLGALAGANGGIALTADGGPLLFNTGGATRQTITANGDVLIARATGVPSRYKLQVGDGVIAATGRFNSTDPYAISVSQGVGQGDYYIGARNSSATPDLGFYSNSATLRFTMTDAGQFDCAAGSGSLRMAGQITRFEVTAAVPAAGGVGSLVTVAHGGPRAPDVYSVSFRCVTAEHGYVAGDEAQLVTIPGSCNYAMSCNGTSISYRSPANGGVPAIYVNSGANSFVGITVANWRIVFKALWL